MKKNHLSRKNLNLLFLFFLLGCQSKIEFSSKQLSKVTEINSTIEKDTIIIAYMDNSLILFEDYNSLKSNVLVFENLEKLRSYSVVKTLGRTPTDKKNFLKTYSQKDLNFIDSLYFNNPIFKDFAIQITSKINLTDWWNFRYAVELTNQQIKHIGDSPMDILYEFSTVTLDSILTSRSYKRLKLIGEMINEKGVTDAFSEEQISSKEFMIKYNYFLERRGLNKVK